jgi:NADH-quinone oxidoreductase subunit G
MSAPQDVTLTIDGISVTVPAGTLLVEAAKQIHTDIPVYCYHEKLGPAGLCRMCLVDVAKTPKLQIACNTTVAPGMIVETRGKKVEEGRRAVLEFLLVNHPLDCPICDKGGECDLQDYTMAYGQGASRLAEPKGSKPKAIDLGPTIVLDDERCVVCQRCSRFDEIITNEQSLVVKDRGQRDVISTATGEPYLSDFSGNVTELCPVGALTSKTYRFKSRPWDLNRTRTSCAQCSLGCGLNLDARFGAVLRTMSADDDDAISEGWLCDRGRYNVAYAQDRRRLTSPLLRRDGEWVQLSWDEAIAAWAESLRGAQPGEIAALGGGRLTNEEAYLLQHIYRGLGASNLDWRAGRQRMALQPIAGKPADLETADAIVTYGRPPSQLAPVLDLRIRKAVKRAGATLISLGTHRAGSHVPETHVESIAELNAALPPSYERLAIVWDGSDGALNDEFSAWCFAQRDAGKTIFAYIPSEQPNGRGAEAMGMLPRDGGLDTFGIFSAAGEGRIRSLAILGANPLLRFADRALADAAFARTPFIVVSELFMTESAERATLVLPAAGAFEKRGTLLNLSGDLVALAPGVPAPEGVLSDGEILVALAAELGIAIPAPDRIEAAVRDLAAEPRSIGAAPYEAPLPPAAGTLTLVIDAPIFTGGGTAAFDERIAILRPQPRARISPETARALGLEAGDTVDLVAGAERAVRDLPIAIDPALAPGSVALVDGLPAAPANALGAATTVALANVRSTRNLAEAPA